MTTPNDPERPEEAPPSRLKPLKFGFNIARWSPLIAIASVIGLFLLTGLASSPWLFLLYPILIGALLFSLASLALHLLHRL